MKFEPLIRQLEDKHFSPSERVILLFLAINPNSTIKQIGRTISGPTAGKFLRALEKRGLVVCSGRVQGDGIHCVSTFALAAHLNDSEVR